MPTFPAPAVSKRSRGPSAFAPAVGVKNSSSTASPTHTSPTGGRPNGPKKGSSSLSSPSHSAPASPPSKAVASGAMWKGMVVHFMSGGLAAGFVRASLQPLDTCKTRLQAMRRTSAGVSRAVAFQTVFAGGVAGLYKGVIPGVVGIVPAAAVYMLTFQTLKMHLSKRFPRRRNDVVVAAAAALGDVAASLVRVPCEVLKQRLQVGVYPNVAAGLRHVTAAGPAGLARLYAGLGAQLTRDVPYAAAEFVVYENLKAEMLRRQQRRSEFEQVTSDKRQGIAAARLQQRLQDRELSRIDGLLVGAGAGALAAVVSNPADVVKTRLMTQVRAAASARTPAHYRGVADAFVRIAREEGVATFAKGLAPRIAAKALQSALFFAVYEGLRRGLGRVAGVESPKRATAH